jgi:NAD(P)-dependent dehydrogenase (short-subunit alcohol dehydrogenase family)
MRGKTVVITGGTSGIGEVVAEALAQMGARIVLIARSKSRADATLARLGRSGPGVGHSVYFADRRLGVHHQTVQRCVERAMAYGAVKKARSNVQVGR